VKAKDIGMTVKALRTDLGMTTTDLAKKVGISQAQISRLENGQQGFRSGTLVKIAKVLKVPPFRLFMTSDEWKKWSKKR
jgi:transcriptional regulator with XRE-family HTH domain